MRQLQHQQNFIIDIAAHKIAFPLSIHYSHFILNLIISSVYHIA